ncbi:hypothetical protein AVEN_124992-1 [Araneus ventricosus]|uniref:Uncharacterized protein n=1 Tax=Araneus ventricosus TaxID=182803 RepID=A0A4Y2EC46_ARAVE|nr:hypothetical protein AVEN_124992-1 [Araneus ventricosus]
MDQRRIRVCIILHGPSGLPRVPDYRISTVARHWFFMPCSTMTSYTRHATKVAVEYDNKFDIFTKGKTCCEINTVMDQSSADCEDQGYWRDSAESEEIRIHLPDTDNETNDGEILPRRRKRARRLISDSRECSGVVDTSSEEWL